MTAGTARIAFLGGGMALPAFTPYDRQLLVEHVLSCARTRADVRVRVDDSTWIVEKADLLSVVCSGCTRRIDRAICRRHRRAAVFCVGCAMARPQLTVASLSQLPPGTILRDVQAHYAYGGEWVSWTRWPRATPAEIIEDVRLQRRFAPVLIWRCAEIQVPRGSAARRKAPAMSAAARLAVAG